MYQVQRHANQKGFLGSRADFQVKVKTVLLPPQSPAAWHPVWDASGMRVTDLTQGLELGSFPFL